MVTPSIKGCQPTRLRLIIVVIFLFYFCGSGGSRTHIPFLAREQYEPLVYHSHKKTLLFRGGLIHPFKCKLDVVFLSPQYNIPLNAKCGTAGPIY